MTIDPALVDFGDGRRLERLGGILVDRPHPAATGPRQRPDLWTDAGAIYAGDATGGAWRFAADPPSPWLVEVPVRRESASAPIRLHARPAPSGQIGIFLEQVPLWHWLFGRSRPGDRVLSLFGHTGGATLAVAAAGAEVFHVDASRQAIGTARDNARCSGLADSPIHWVEEDAARYCRRLVRRGERFSGIVLDPPSWGHGPRGEAFSIDRDLEPLLKHLAAILAPGGFLLLTSHSPGWSDVRLADAIAAAFGAAHTIDRGRLSCDDAAGRHLDLGRFARISPSELFDP